MSSTGTSHCGVSVGERRADVVPSENCRRQDALGLLDSDTIALTTNLVTYWKNEEVHCGMRLRSLEKEDVLPFLRYNLHWRVLDVRIRVRAT